MKKRLIQFLAKEYGYTDVRSFSPHKRFAAAMNAIYLAKDAEGKTIFIKTCRYGDMCENEYRTGLALWEQAPQHFAKPLAYHVGKRFSFCSSEYVPGKDLYALLTDGTPLTGEQRAQMVEDIYTIHQALVRADIVHRDVVLKNMLYHQGRVVLIDCQLATKRNETKVTSFFDHILKICKCRWMSTPGPSFLEWDDVPVLLKSIQSIGSTPAHQERFEFICAELLKARGTLVYTHPYPSMEELHAAIKTCRLRSLFHHQAKMRHRYRCMIPHLQYLKDHHPEQTQEVS
ncbi:MAG: hypothetical protein IJ985_04055 [Akkermansia sp.]|nr:hypothetical protein [Akkermansia sp.]